MCKTSAACNRQYVLLSPAKCYWCKSIFFALVTTWPIIWNTLPNTSVVYLFAIKYVPSAGAGKKSMCCRVMWRMQCEDPSTVQQWAPSLIDQHWTAQNKFLQPLHSKARFKKKLRAPWGACGLQGGTNSHQGSAVVFANAYIVNLTFLVFFFQVW